MPNSQVSIVGNVVANPELRQTGSGIGVANFTVAVSEGTSENPRTSFYDVTAWRNLGVNVVDTVRKGMRVIVMGTLTQRSWETQDGSKRSKVEITAEAVGPDLRFAGAQVFPNQQTENPQRDPHREGGLNTAREALAQAQVTNSFPGAETVQGYNTPEGQPRSFADEPF